jgi:DNA repair exonuclease SbcCD nuclease subunit
LPNFTFLHAADIHLDSPLAGLSRYDGVPADDIRRAPRAAFDRLIEAAIDRRVDFVIIAGDLYDGDWKDMRTGLYFAAAMGKLGRAGIPVYLLAGNHDAASIITKELPPIPNVHRFSTREPEQHRIERLNVVIHGRSFATRQTVDNLAAGYPAAVSGAFNIGVLHTSLAGYAAHETYAPCTVQELAAKGYDYWALGHVHEYQIVAAQPYIVFPGNIQGRHIRESGPRGAVLVHVEDGEVAALERLELDAVRWVAIDVDAAGAEDMQALYDRARDALRRAWDALPRDRAMVVRLTFSGATTLHGALQDSSVRLRDDLRAIAADISAELWIEKIRVTTSAPVQSTGAARDGRIGSLIAEPDPALGVLLREDLAKFLAALPGLEPDGLLASAKAGEWDPLLQTATAAVRHRLGEPD